jgi:AhpD family alkylhydroperoxidase
MSTVKILDDADLSPAAAAVFADIRATRKTEFVGNFWRGLAHDPVLLKRTWESVKEVMTPGALDALTKELIYVAVSMANGCEYCIRSHTAAARAKGMSQAQLLELVAVVGMASETNRLATGLLIPVDEAFLESRPEPAGDRADRGPA